jgi:Concanavalin A-like lectin/glucanases superfamily
VRERTNPVDATKFNGFSKGLVAYLPLDVTISEQSGSQLRCTNHGTTAVPDRFGVQNNARDFDGLGNNIEITGSAPLQIPRDITISFWVFSRDDDALILAKGNGECAYSVGFSGLTKGIAFMRQNIEYVAVTDNPLRASEWVHITCTQDEHNSKIYYNGSLVQTGFSSIFGIGDGALTLGTIYSGTPVHFNGVIDDVRIYNRALSNEEVSTLHDSESNQFQIASSPTDNGTITGAGSYTPGMYSDGIRLTVGSFRRVV